MCFPTRMNENTVHITPYVAIETVHVNGSASLPESKFNGLRGTMSYELIIVQKGGRRGNYAFFFFTGM